MVRPFKLDRSLSNDPIVNKPPLPNDLLSFLAAVNSDHDGFCSERVGPADIDLP